MNKLKNTEKASAFVSCIICVVVVVCLMHAVFYFIELPYQEFARAYSSSVSISSITNEPTTIQESELVSRSIQRLVAWFTVFVLVGPATYLHVYRPVRKYTTKYRRKIK